MIQLAPALSFIYFSARGLYAQLETEVEQAATGVYIHLSKFPPDLFGAANIVVEFITGLPGVFLTSYYSGVEDFVLQEVRKAKLHNRLIRFDDAISITFASVRQGIQELTLTSEDGVILYVAQNIAHFVWRFAKNVALVRRLIGAETFEEVVDIIFRKLKKRALFIRAAAFYVGVVVFFAFVGFQILLVGFLSNLITGDTIKKVLAQDSKKQRFKVRSVRHRVNIRKGPDA